MPDKATGTGALTASSPDGSAATTAEAIFQNQLKEAQDAGIIQELSRTVGITKVCEALGLPFTFANEHIQKRTTLEKFRELAIDKKADEAEKFGNSGGVGGVKLISDETDKRRVCMSAAVTGLMNPKERKEDPQNPFMGLSIKQIAEESVRLQHGLRGIPPMAKVVELAMQITSDFANVLATTARKQLLNGYQYANPTYRVWTRRSTTPDFKTMSRNRLSEAPVFKVVPEGGQITIGAMSDSKESYALATYGRGISFSRQMLINDDLGAFNDLITQFGIQAARLENKTVYAILYANANMSDVHPLFDNTYHKNTGTGALGNTGFDTMFGTMGVQTGVDGVTVLNLIPRFVIVPKAKEATARTALVPTGPALAAASQNLYAGLLDIVSDAELDTNGSGTTVWYGAADPALAPGIEYAHLEGAEGPQFIREENQNGVLGLQFYAYLDFAAKAVDWRPLYYSTGS